MSAPVPLVTSVVVTYNRRALLEQSLDALMAQTRAVDRLIVVDNASVDGTSAMVRARFPDVDLVVLPRNTGGAGGFHAGLAEAQRQGADWIWLLDDDTVARPDALERLLAALGRAAGLPAPSVLASRVDWTDGTPHPMNMPIVRRRDPALMLEAVALGLVPVRTATFVSVLIARPAVDRHGLPLRHFFFQADDIEFTARILRTAHGYLVPDSVVEHRTASAHDALGDPRRFFFHLRNTVLMMRGDAWSPAEKAALAWLVAESALRYVRRGRFDRRAFALVGRALRDGLLLAPRG